MLAKSGAFDECTNAPVVGSQYEELGLYRATGGLIGTGPGPTGPGPTGPGPTGPGLGTDGAGGMG